MGRKVKELQAVLDKHVPDVAEGVLEIQPGETDGFLLRREVLPTTVWHAPHSQTFLEEPLLDETVKVLV